MKTQTKQFLFHLTPELLQSIDDARGDAPRCGWLESQLWKLKAVREAARASGVDNPGRPVERRGKYQRKGK